MEALAGLDGEKAELVEGGRDGEGEVGVGGFHLGAFGGFAGGGRVEAQSSSPFGLPLLVRVGEVENVADPAAADHVVVTE